MAEHFFGITDTGKVRTNNEDSFIAETAFVGRLTVACVIDGVGGYEGGEVASDIANQTIKEYLQKPFDDIVIWMKDAFTAANKAIYLEKQKGKETAQMACVLTLALADIDNNKFYYAHVGDTRLYLLRDKSLVKLSRDHSFVGFLEDSGRLTEEAAMRHPKRNEINKALGLNPTADLPEDFIETGNSPFLPGDIILLCSDGLTDMIDNNAITSILNSINTLQAKAKALVQSANNAGGRDNITVVLVENNKTPVKQEATKPVIATAKAIETPPSSAVIVNKKSNSGLVALLTLLCILLAAAVAWLFYQHYWKTEIQPPQPVINTIAEKPINLLQQRLQDSINALYLTTVTLKNFVATQQIIITDTIHIRKDSLRILGSGLTLISDSSYKKLAFSIAPSCRYILLDSMVIDGFDIGALVMNKSLHLNKVLFKNCKVPVQYNIQLPEGKTVTTVITDTFFNQPGTPYKN